MIKCASAFITSASGYGEGISKPLDDEITRCPVSQTIGSKVGLITVKALLKGDALRRLKGKEYRFCPERNCDVVYFDREARSIFQKRDLVVRVGQKELEDPVPLCYCFDVTEADLRRDIAAKGETNIPAIVTAEIKAGHCACEVKNPQGSCCLVTSTAPWLASSRALERGSSGTVEGPGTQVRPK